VLLIIYEVAGNAPTGRILRGPYCAAHVTLAIVVATTRPPKDLFVDIAA
jgi:hypothetical protein